MDKADFGFGVFIGLATVCILFGVASLGASFKLADIRHNIEWCGKDKIECYQKILEMKP